MRNALISMAKMTIDGNDLPTSGRMQPVGLVCRREMFDPQTECRTTERVCSIVFAGGRPPI